MIGVNHKNMNNMNKFLLLKSIVRQSLVSRIELSQQTGLSKMTVTALVNDFIEKGIVRECGESRSTGGRRRTCLEAVPNSLITLGIYISRDKLEVGLLNLKGEIVQSKSIKLSLMESNDIFLLSLYSICDRMFESKHKDNIWGIGISCAGPLSITNGVILNPPDFNNIQDLPIVEKMMKRYKKPAYLQNDMCVAALCEVYFGNNQNSNFIYVGVSSGIGGGVIINQKLYTGTNGLAGIIGHSIVKMNGLPCECGQCGCLEKYSSTRAVVKWLKLQTGEQSLTWEEVVDKVANKDDLATKAVERMGEYLSVAVANMESAFDTECFIIGGDLHQCQEIIVTQIEENLNKRAFSSALAKKVKVKPSSFMSNSSFIGTVALVMENNLES